MRNHILVLALAGVMLAACGKSDDKKDGSAETKVAKTCADGLLPGVNLCRNEAQELIELSESANPKAPEGCDWAVNEAALPNGRYLLYTAAECKGKTTKLTYSGDEKRGELKIEESAVDPAGNGAVMLRMLTGETGMMSEAILAFVKEDAQHGGADPTCHVRPDSRDGWPNDALSVDVSDEEIEKLKDQLDGPRSACGLYGFGDDAGGYWRIQQSLAWYVELGPHAGEIDPGAFAVVEPDGPGKWKRSE